MAKKQAEYGQPGHYNVTPATREDGDPSGMEMDALGNLKGTAATLAAGEDLTNDVVKVEERFTFANIATATTTVVKTGAGFFHLMVINTTAAGAITIYDNTAGSGTKIATFPISAITATYLYDVTFGTGLTIVTAGASDLTISFR